VTKLQIMNIKAKRQQVLKCVKRENLCLTMQTQLQSKLP